MPRGRRRNTPQDARLAEIIEHYVSEIVGAVKDEVRRSVADELQGFITGSSGPAAARALLKSPLRRKRLLPCIAPGCTNPSKGPRFHYLCDKHKDASKKDYEAWRKAVKSEKAAA